MKKSNIKQLVPKRIWGFFRERKIHMTHDMVSDICVNLLNEPIPNEIIKPKKDSLPEKIIWQYWAQGFDDVPELVRMCLDSVDRYAGDYCVIRVSDDTIEDYLELPSYVRDNAIYSNKTKLSNLLRLALLYYYGGLWIDSTVLLSGPVASSIEDHDFFAYYRDYSEKEKTYWKNTYAYYFGWDKRFRVNVLTSFMFAKKETALVRDYYMNYLKWWSMHQDFPDYFFIQVLFDVLIENGEYDYATENDCFPHHLMQSFTDPKYSLMTQEEILSTIHVHKLSYKSCSADQLKELIG